MGCIKCWNSNTALIFLIVTEITYLAWVDLCLAAGVFKVLCASQDAYGILSLPPILLILPYACTYTYKEEENLVKKYLPFLLPRQCYLYADVPSGRNKRKALQRQTSSLPVPAMRLTQSDLRNRGVSTPEKQGISSSGPEKADKLIKDNYPNVYVTRPMARVVSWLFKFLSSI